MASLPAEFPWGLGADAATAATASAESFTFRLAQYLKGKPNVESILDSLGQQAADLAAVLSSLDIDRRLSNAFGEQLDVIGAIVGQPRAGASDDLYRARIAAGILLNNSSGTPEEVIAIMDRLKPVGAVIELRDWFPAAFVLFVGGVALSEDQSSLLARFLRTARAAGVRGLFHWSPAAPADTFTFDGTSAQALDVGEFAGAVI